MTRIGCDRRGAVAVVGAIAMTAILGVAGLAVDVGLAYAQRARLQKTADSAAMAGAIAWVKTNSATAVLATVKAVVVANGWPVSVVKATGTGYMAQSPKNSTNPAVQVSLAAPSPVMLASVASSLRSLNTSAYSAAEIGDVSVLACILSLSTLMVNSGVRVDVNGCAIVANSTASNAITVNSGGGVIAGVVQTPGGVVVNNGASVTATIDPHGVAAADPYASYQSQATSGFVNCQNYASQTTLSPGCYSNVNVNSSLTLSPGAYYFTGLNVNSGASLTGTGGVTIVTQSSFSPSGNVTITAPQSGVWAGMAIYAKGGMNINSGVRYSVNGAIYSPTSAVIPNSGTWDSGACTYLVAYSITFNSGSRFDLPQNNCAAFNYPEASVPGASKIALVQ